MIRDFNIIRANLPLHVFPTFFLLHLCTAKPCQYTLLIYIPAMPRVPCSLLHFGDLSMYDIGQKIKILS